jgi:cyclic 2,3-diphosphoglycerate synthetase
LSDDPAVAVIALIDGEHHPDAVREALDRLEEDRGLAAVVFCGGEEKLPLGALERAEELYGRPLARSEPRTAVRSAADRADAVVDLADEPALSERQRVRLAAAALRAGLAYEAPGMRLDAPRRAPSGFAGRTVSVFGTGKRTGKTAVAGHLARLLGARGRNPALVCMGRGGPAEPRVAEGGIGVDELLSLAKHGEHAASDYLEGAALAGVPSVGARRVGGGWLSGQPGPNNFAAAVGVAASLPVDALIFEGSGACLPPVEAGRWICVAGTRLGSQAELAFACADLVLAPAGGPADEELPDTDAPVLRFELVSEPAHPLPVDARVALFTTGPATCEGVDPVLHSTALARRAELGQALDRAAAEGCDVYLTELKAAAIDTVAARARSEGAELVLLRNVPVGAGCDLDAELLACA